ncbi:uncharacterized protein MONBRDRAFT_4861 [Monosiga brevicollis MX1]|uniref:PH domain-containing protein n=1 Tax=Monosiga brevicollis TaxID=81824 RepID=A9UP61_MONBE|nr:uncharacterized protein MONBRDRAFT_4861 [Monosiga brevicollis MX1]EDQ92818.1 predicted protein [Monosiga brevicollis MX1]|eukprot:XP_001742580.1 hypothetical protein [Monosiga brevicollis MX1]
MEPPAPVDVTVEAQKLRDHDKYRKKLKNNKVLKREDHVRQRMSEKRAMEAVARKQQQAAKHVGVVIAEQAVAHLARGQPFTPHSRPSQSPGWFVLRWNVASVLHPIFNCQDAIRAKYGLSAPDSGPSSTLGAPGTDLIMCGYLEKRGKLNKAFKRRWFRIVGLELEYYEDVDGVKKGSVGIAYPCVCHIEDCKGRPELRVRCSRDSRVYALRSESDSLHELNQWKTAIDNQQKRVPGPR